MFDLWEKGDVAGARLVNARMLESFAFETGDEAPNPLPTKAVLRHLGLPVGQARLPMGRRPRVGRRTGPRGARQPAALARRVPRTPVRESR